MNPNDFGNALIFTLAALHHENWYSLLHQALSVGQISGGEHGNYKHKHVSIAIMNMLAC